MNTSSVQPGRYPFLNCLNFLLSLTRSSTLNLGLRGFLFSFFSYRLSQTFRSYLSLCCEIAIHSFLKSTIKSFYYTSFGIPFGRKVYNIFVSISKFGRCGCKILFRCRSAVSVVFVHQIVSVSFQKLL